MSEKHRNYTAYNRKQRKKWRVEQRKILKNLLGSKCIICGTETSLLRHEIFGSKHPRSRYGYMIKNVQNFRCLCFWCHTVIHHLAKREIDFDQLILLVKKLKEKGEEKYECNKK